MADGMNNIRAMRVSELMGDYRNLQTYMANIRASPSAEEYNEDGYVVLRQCVAQSQALLQQPFQSEAAQRGDEEQNKAQLRRYDRSQRMCARERGLTREQNHSRRGRQEIPSEEALHASNGGVEMGQRQDDDSPGTEAACWACACFAADSEPAS